MNIDVYRSTLCKLSYSNNRNDSIFISDNITDCQCYINYNNNAVFITFRGSSSIDDWKLFPIKCASALFLIDFR